MLPLMLSFLLVYLTILTSLELRFFSYKSIRKRYNNPITQRAKDLNRHFGQENGHIDNEHMERC